MKEGKLVLENRLLTCLSNEDLVRCIREYDTKLADEVQSRIGYYFKELDWLSQQLEKKNPEAWVPLRIACSALLTQQTNLKYVDFPKTVEEWLNVWKEICPNVNTRPCYSVYFENWLKYNNDKYFLPSCT